MRLLGVLAIVAPVMIGILFSDDPRLTASWVVDGSRSVVAAIMAITLGVAHDRRPRLDDRAHPLRAPGQGRREDRRRATTPSRSRPRGGGLEARLGDAINAISASLADTHDRATIDRLTGVANRQALLAYLFAEVERALALRATAVRRVRRHRPLQGGQRLVRPRRGRHRPARRRPDDRREPPRQRPDRPLRRRGIHADPDRDRRRGRRRR